MSKWEEVRALGSCSNYVSTFLNTSRRLGHGLGGRKPTPGLGVRGEGEAPGLCMPNHHEGTVLSATSLPQSGPFPHAHLLAVETVWRLRGARQPADPHTAGIRTEPRGLLSSLTPKSVSVVCRHSQNIPPHPSLQPQQRQTHKRPLSPYTHARCVCLQAI